MDTFEPGKTVSFRLPHDTPKQVSDHLTKRKKELGRKFSSEIAPLFVEAITDNLIKPPTSDVVTIPLPKGLTLDQKEWLNNPNTKSLLSQLIYQVMQSPGTPFEIGSPEQKVQLSSTPSFQVDDKIKNFAQKTFLDFDDEDD
jgi:hypothetical protein